MRKVVAIIQARMGSTRLPGKMLLPLNGQPVIARVVQRVKRTKLINAIWLATTSDITDDPLAAWAKQHRVLYYRGSVNDVLDRYYQTAQLAQADVIVRVTGDCPLIDPLLIDKTIDTFFKRGADYAAVNRRIISYPDGFDVEVLSDKVLKRAWQEASLKSEREHVTPYLWKHPKKFKSVIMRSPVDLSHFRLTLDEPADYDLLKKIYRFVRPLTTPRILKFLTRHADIFQLNSDIMRDAGYAQSLREDKDQS